MAVTLIRDMKSTQARIGIRRDARPPSCPTPQGDSGIGSLIADGADITDGIDGAGRGRSSKRVAASRESAAHFSRRDTRIESVSRNPFFPPSACHRTRSRSVASSVSDDPGGDGPIRPTLQKTINATERGRSFDNNIEARNIGSAEQVWSHISVSIFLS